MICKRGEDRGQTTAPKIRERCTQRNLPCHGISVQEGKLGDGLTAGGSPQRTQGYIFPGTSHVGAPPSCEIYLQYLS